MIAAPAPSEPPIQLRVELRGVPADAAIPLAAIALDGPCAGTVTAVRPGAAARIAPGRYRLEARFPAQVVRLEQRITSSQVIVLDSPHAAAPWLTFASWVCPGAEATAPPWRPMQRDQLICYLEVAVDGVETDAEAVVAAFEADARGSGAVFHRGGRFTLRPPLAFGAGPDVVMLPSTWSRTRDCPLRMIWAAAGPPHLVVEDVHGLALWFARLGDLDAAERAVRLAAAVAATDDGWLRVALAYVSQRLRSRPGAPGFELDITGDDVPDAGPDAAILHAAHLLCVADPSPGVRAAALDLLIDAAESRDPPLFTEGVELLAALLGRLVAEAVDPADERTRAAHARAVKLAACARRDSVFTWLTGFTELATPLPRLPVSAAARAGAEYELRIDLEHQRERDYVAVAWLFNPASGDLAESMRAGVRLPAASPGTSAEVEGAALADSLFGDAGFRAQLADAVARAESDGGRLNVRLAGLDAASARLRWEAMVDPCSGRRLFTSRRLGLARSIALPPVDDRTVPRAARTTADARALIAIAAPELDPRSPLDDRIWPVQRIDVARERDTALTALAYFTPALLAAPCTLAAISRALVDSRADILYLVCHGRLRPSQSSELLLADDHGLATVVPGGELIRVLAALEHRPALVYLASCESAGTADGRGGLTALGPQLVAAAEIPAVVAMMDRVDLATSERFARGFFAALAEHGKVLGASSVGRSAIAGCRDWWAPVLFTRADVDRIFDRDHAAEAAWDTVAAAVPAQFATMQQFEPAAAVYVKRRLELEIAGFLDDRDHCHRAMMVITGQSGMGKSSAIAHVLRERHHHGDLCSYVYSFHLQAVTEVALIGYITRDRWAAGDPDAFWSALDRECARRGRRCIIAIDAVNESRSPRELLASLDVIGRRLRRLGLRRIRVLISSRPEVWRGGAAAARLRMLDSDGAYHVLDRRVDHVLGRYSAGEAMLAYTRYARLHRVSSALDDLSELVRSQLRDPLLLALTCRAFAGGEIGAELDGGAVFEALQQRVREHHRQGQELLAAIDAITRRMFDRAGEVIERDSLALDADLRDHEPALFGDLGVELRDLNILRRDTDHIRFTYDRYAEYRLSEHLFATIVRQVDALDRGRRVKRVVAMIRANLPASFRMTTAFRAVRRTLRRLAETEPRFLAILRELAGDERGLALVVSVMGALAMRGRDDDGRALVDALLTGMEAKVDAAKRAAPFPIIDIVHRLLLDEEYDAWRRRDETTRARHEEMLDRRFAWGIRHPKLDISTAAVQYLFFLWRSPLGRRHAARITRQLVADTPALYRLLFAGDRAFLQNLTGCFMLALAEARSDAEARPILELGRSLFRAIDPDQSLIVRAAGAAMPGIVREFLIERMLEANENPVNYAAFVALFGDDAVKAVARDAIELIRSDAAWDGRTLDGLLALAATPNPLALQTLCYALSIRWERLARAGDTEGMAAHLELLGAMSDRGSPSIRYLIALALYHINYFGEAGTADSVRRMGAVVEVILRVDRGRFQFPGDDRRFNTNVIGTYGRVLALHDRQLVEPRTIPGRPVLSFAIDMLNAAKQHRCYDDYAYVCENIGLLGTLAQPHAVFDVIAYVLADLDPRRYAAEPGLERVPLPRAWTQRDRVQLRQAVMTGLANVRVLYRAEVDQWILETLDDQALYTRIATQEQTDFQLATFYSWTCEHLMYRMLTRYHEQIGADYLTALDDALGCEAPGEGILVVVRALLAQLRRLAAA